MNSIDINNSQTIQNRLKTGRTSTNRNQNPSTITTNTKNKLNWRDAAKTRATKEPEMGANYMKLKLNLIIVPKNVLTTENRINWGQPETLQNRQD